MSSRNKACPSLSEVRSASVDFDFLSAPYLKDGKSEADHKTHLLFILNNILLDLEYPQKLLHLLHKRETSLAPPLSLIGCYML